MWCAWLFSLKAPEATTLATLSSVSLPPSAVPVGREEQEEEEQGTVGAGGGLGRERWGQEGEGVGPEPVVLVEDLEVQVVVTAASDERQASGQPLEQERTQDLKEVGSQLQSQEEAQHQEQLEDQADLEGPQEPAEAENQTAVVDTAGDCLEAEPSLGADPPEAPVADGGAKKEELMELSEVSCLVEGRALSEEECSSEVVS